MKNHYNLLVVFLSLSCLILLYLQGHYSIITFLTALIFVASLGLLLLKRGPITFKIAWITTIIMLLIVEIFFRITGSKNLSSHTEINSKSIIKKYISPYNINEYNNQLVEGIANLSYCFERREYTHCRDNNSYGIPHSRSIEPWKSNILFLGDSFTEGQGVPEDQSYVTNIWNKFNKQYNCINGGLGGADIFTEWQLYKNKLEVLKPEVIIFLMNTTDVVEVMVRGGDERFTNKKTGNRTKWEPIYATSFTVRKIVLSLGYNWLLKSRKRSEQMHLEAFEKIKHKVSQIYEDCANGGPTVFFVLHPSDVECKNNKYDFKDFPSVLEHVPNGYDINTISAFYNNDLCDKIYWEYDRHFNEKGYRILAEIIYDNLNEKITNAMQD